MARSDRNGRQDKSPAFQWYPADALADDEFGAMSYEERGVYITLLSLAWINRGLPGDPARVQRLLRLSDPEFERIWSVVGRCFRLDEDAGMFFNARLERERQAQDAYRARARAHGKRGASKRWAMPEDAALNARALPEQSPSTARGMPGDGPTTHYPLTPTTVGDARARETPPSEDPDSAPLAKPPLLAQLAMHPKLDLPVVREALNRWEAHRSARGRQPWTAAAAATNLTAWERWGVPKLLAAVDHWIGRNSTTAFEPDPRDIDVHGSLESAKVEDTPSSGYLEMQAAAKARRAAKRSKGGAP